jgi:hypothetical protein
MEYNAWKSTSLIYVYRCAEGAAGNDETPFLGTDSTPKPEEVG